MRKTSRCNGTIECSDNSDELGCQLGYPIRKIRGSFLVLSPKQNKKLAEAFIFIYHSPMILSIDKQKKKNLIAQQLLCTGVTSGVTSPSGSHAAAPPPACYSCAGYVFIQPLATETTRSPCDVLSMFTQLIFSLSARLLKS